MRNDNCPECIPSDEELYGVDETCDIKEENNTNQEE